MIPLSITLALCLFGVTSMASAHGAVSTGRAVTTTAVPAMVLQVVESGCDGMTINWPDWVKS